MIGAHLDSVRGRPGHRRRRLRRGSLLEIATELGAKPSVQNMVRFAFFGGEENGADGSTGYLDGLSDRRP